ncbi:MAG: hypothetical protein ACOYMG_02360 [Candidatus Methylumidiphilus sp.]
MLIISKAQMHAMVLSSRRLLIIEIEQHLAEFRPDIPSIYPRPYLRWLINDSIELAKPFNIDDAYSMRLFVRLRWEIAPGFHRQAQIANVLAQTTRPAEDRFAELATLPYADAWEEARKFAGAREWRTHFWVMDA